MHDWKQEVRSRLSELSVSPAREAEIVEELAQHLRDRCEDLQSRGTPEIEAERAVLAELDQGHLAHELRRVERSYAEPIPLGAKSRGNVLSSLWHDLRYAARVLRLNPSFTTVCVLSLALGIGANTAIFQLIDSVRMRALPVKDPQQLAIIRIADRHWMMGHSSGRYQDLSAPLWFEIQRRQEGFSQIAAWAATDFNLATGGQARLARGIYASGDFFNMLGVPAILGRVFTPSDDVRGCGASSAVISYAFWQGEFGGDPNVVGRKLSLSGQIFRIIGVTPASFYGVEVGRGFDVAVPLCSEQVIRGEQTMYDQRHGWWLGVMGRVKPGWSLTRASTQLSAISPAAMEATVPPVYDSETAKKYHEYRLAAFPGATGFSTLRREYETPLWLLLGIAGLVLLIACANLANLMLARASARQREIAVRLALGAARGRLVRQLLTESLLIALSGAALGAVLAANLSKFLVAYLGTQHDLILLDRAFDWRVLGFTTALAVLTCLLFGLAPALQATKAAPARVVNAAGRGMTASRERFTLRRALVITQVALSLVLVVGALLFTRTLRNILTLDAGFQRDGLLVVDVDFSRLNVPADQRVPYRERLLERVRALPGVQSAADTFIVPVSGSGWNDSILVDGKRVENTFVNMNNVSDGYFKTMGTPLIEGRDFDARDNVNSPKVAIVNQAFARKMFGSDNAIGKSFVIETYQGEPRFNYEIVGVVKNTKYFDLRDNFDPIAYYPETQDRKPDAGTEIVVRSNLDLHTLIAEIRDTFSQVNAGIDIDFHSFSTQIKEGLLRERLLSTLSGFFGLLAGILATVGLYGVIAYSVVRRTNEIGIRMALGAQPRAILRMVVLEGTRLLGIGLIIGAVLSLVGARAVRALLYGLKPYDPATLMLAAVVLTAAAVAASLFPARRAARLDPMVALREE